MTELRFRQIETTADMGMLAWGRSEKALFENAAAGLSHIIAGPGCARGTEIRFARAEGIDSPARLVAWLSEWLYLFDSQGFVGRSFRIEEMGGEVVAGRGWGELHDPARHDLLCGVKGITYHQLEIRRQGGRLRARVILDV